MPSIATKPRPSGTAGGTRWTHMAAAIAMALLLAAGMETACGQSSVELPSWSPSRPDPRPRTSADSAPGTLPKFDASPLSDRNLPSDDMDFASPDFASPASFREYTPSQFAPNEGYSTGAAYPYAPLAVDPVGCDDGQMAWLSSGWFRAEVLGWSTKGESAPALVTTSPDGTDREDAGVLGLPGTTVLFGGERLNGDARTGIRLTLGLAVGPDPNRGFELSYLYLDKETSGFAAASNGSPILARPFLNVLTGEQASNLIAYPDLVQGTIAIGTQTEFQGLELSWRRPVLQAYQQRIDVMGGFRWLELKDTLLIVDQLESLDDESGLVVGTLINTRDDFQTDNDFYGLNLATTSVWYWNFLKLELLGKLGVGATRARVYVQGASRTRVPTVPSLSTNNGFLAQPTNSGEFDETKFALVPEVDAQLHWDLTQHARLSFGYTFIYWSRVMRASEQIDMGLNLTQLPPGPLVGVERPVPLLDWSGMWAQGLNLSFEYRF